MRSVLRIVGAVMIALGLLFTGQGAGLINWPGDSFMLGATEWVLYGIVIAGIGLMLIGFSARQR